MEIADAIREKDGTSSLIDANDFSSKMLANRHLLIKIHNIIFFDIDGTFRYTIHT